MGVPIELRAMLGDQLVQLEEALSEVIVAEMGQHLDYSDVMTGVGGSSIKAAFRDFHLSVGNMRKDV